MRNFMEIGLRTSRARLIAVGAGLGLVMLAACQQPSTDASAAEPELTAPAASTTGQPELSWGPAPAVLPVGAELAVLQGDPGSNAPFTIRLRFPSGYRIAPHTH